ncbi:ribosome biogenesis GTPase Der [Candidatus Saccharibacteria bacterium]|nr:ribosome biogenesis GTPase Der [Candidatus Saccharibacteria bacterium]MCA9328939.1 ribosome biogenesis GTPase Der [Candidatus Saccharibacteria bacterium]
MGKRVPIVAIVGRANVGKSSLFNALLGRREAIVANEPGTTRDSITAKAELESGKQFWLVDTAGLKDAADAFELTIQDQITEAANSADIILVTVDGTTMITDEDRRVAKMAFKSGKKLILLVNKADKAKKEQVQAFEKLGIKPLIATSATQKKGFDVLEEALEEVLPSASIVEADDRIRIALLGRPNVGKSSLYNALAKKQQAIVADRAGTTRDVNHTIIKYMGRELELLDTAGIRRSGKIEKGIEHFSVLRSLQAIEQADVCLLLVDANELSVALDQKIAGLIKEAGKGLVLVVSKWDIKEKDAFTRDDIAPGIANDFNFIPWAPLVFTSSETGKNVSKIFDLALDIMEKRAQVRTTRELNNWLKKITDRHPPAGLKNRQPKLRYMVQEDWNPIPSFKIFGAHTKYLHWSYKRHMEKMLREEWDYSGTPVQLWFIDRDVEKQRDEKFGGRKFKNNGNRDRTSNK